MNARARSMCCRMRRPRSTPSSPRRAQIHRVIHSAATTSPSGATAKMCGCATRRVLMDSRPSQHAALVRMTLPSRSTRACAEASRISRATVTPTTARAVNRITQKFATTKSMQGRPITFASADSKALLELVHSRCENRQLPSGAKTPTANGLCPRLLAS